MEADLQVGAPPENPKNVTAPNYRHWQVASVEADLQAAHRLARSSRAQLGGARRRWAPTWASRAASAAGRAWPPSWACCSSCAASLSCTRALRCGR